ncbi:MAG: threonine/serine exporter family protein, partial [Gemmatimonadales bacterium]
MTGDPTLPGASVPGTPTLRERYPEATERAIAGFVLRLGRALHSYGYAADQLEDVLESASERLNIAGQFFTTPTSIFAAFGSQDNQQTFLIRVEPGDQDLGKLADLTDVTNAVLDGELSPVAGSQRIDEIVSAAPRYRAALTLPAFALVSAAASRFLGGGLREVQVATVIGALT